MQMVTQPDLTTEESNVFPENVHLLPSMRPLQIRTQSVVTINGQKTFDRSLIILLL